VPVSHIAKRSLARAVAKRDVARTTVEGAMTSVPSESPAVARRRLRLALRKAREARDLTKADVARELDWSLSKVNRIESGEVSISSTDLRALLDLVAITDPERVSYLIDLGRAARRRGWWDEARYRDHLTPAMMQLAQFETEATAIRFFNTTVVPGVMQTAAYAESVLEFWSEDLSEKERATRAEIRTRRRDQMLNRPGPPSWHVVLDESVPMREIGGKKVMAEQLQHLLELAHRPHISLRVLPLAEGGPPAVLGMFFIFDLGDEENAILYRESGIFDEIIHSRDRIERHRRRFEQMRELSLSDDASARLIEATAAGMLATLDRQP
jgi:transcriptional regulator with XRE-family HTH domain